MSAPLVPSAFRETALRLESEIARVIVGQREVVRHTLIALLANGHLLLEGLPGLGKTMLVRTLATTLQLDFTRVQFTPDLMPSDITGTNVIDEMPDGRREFRFVRGPVFANIVLADEINRTPPKTQAALLQSMQEREVSVGQETYPLPDPFFVIATQNPIEQEGTYPLPEAQLDRFMFAGGCAGGYCSAPNSAAFKGHIHFDSGVAAGVENFTCKDINNGGHASSLFALFLKPISHKGTKDTKWNDPAGYLCGLAAL